MAAVTLIGFRMDLYSVIHSIWLCVMFAMKRSTLSRIWNIYLVFIAVFLPIQYLMTVGLPPSFCIGKYKTTVETKSVRPWICINKVFDN